jgi:hypothetical protein
VIIPLIANNPARKTQITDNPGNNRHPVGSPQAEEWTLRPLPDPTPC